MYESLHNHTKASDGQQSYADVIEAAEAMSYSVIAFTDHDTLPTPRIMEGLRDYDGPVDWVVGCEITSGLPKELEGSTEGLIHMLGFFTDPTNKALREHCRKAVEARRERLERMVKNLTRIGMTITVEDCLNQSGGENVGRQHIVRALARYPENREVIESIRLQMEEAAKSSPSVAMEYMYMMSRFESDLPFRLFLSRDAFLPDVYVDYLYQVDLDASVKLIRDAGGVAIYAHWWTDRDRVPLELVEKLLEEGRIDGVEIRSGFLGDDVITYGAKLKEIADRLDKAWTVGGDSHRENDMGHFARNFETAELAKGQTQRLIERFKPNLSTCSSLRSK